MKYKLPLLLVLICVTFYSTSAQQDTKRTPLNQISYNDNVDAPLTNKELNKIKEVYGNHIDEYVLDNPQRLKDIKNILRNRVVIFDAKNKDLSSLNNLSQVALFTSYNKALNRDTYITADSFNPLKYQFNFYSRNGETFRLDNTSTIIIIKPQHKN